MSTSTLPVRLPPALLLPALLLAATGCSPARVKLADLQTPQDVVDACAEYEPETVVLQVVFPAQADICPWGEGDNLDTPQNGFFTARVEQQQSLDVPEDAVICGMSFDMSGLVPGEVQVMVYDDHFFFDFNDAVLAASFGPAVDELPTHGSLHAWDWGRVQGMNYHDWPTYDPYCLGQEAGSAGCEIPDTETQGPISLAYDDALVAELSLAAVQQGRYDFSFITTGDDNPESDCQHAEFGFTVEVPYLTP